MVIINRIVVPTINIKSARKFNKKVFSLKPYDQEKNIISKIHFDDEVAYYVKIKDSERNILVIHSNA